MKLRSIYWLSILQFTLTCAIAGESPAPARDGSHDFDFLIGNWKAHVRRLPDRLVGSNNWIEYNGISNHKKLLDSNANFESLSHIREASAHQGADAEYNLKRVNGASIYSIWTKAFELPPVVGNLMGIAASFTTRNNIKAARFWCATSG